LEGKHPAICRGCIIAVKKQKIRIQLRQNKPSGQRSIIILQKISTIKEKKCTKRAINHPGGKNIILSGCSSNDVTQSVVTSDNKTHENIIRSIES